MSVDEFQAVLLTYDVTSVDSCIDVQPDVLFDVKEPWPDAVCDGGYDLVVEAISRLAYDVRRRRAYWEGVAAAMKPDGVYIGHADAMNPDGVYIGHKVREHRVESLTRDQVREILHTRDLETGKPTDRRRRPWTAWTVWTALTAGTVWTVWTAVNLAARVQQL
jgi:hypothetical protein